MKQSQIFMKQLSCFALQIAIAHYEHLQQLILESDMDFDTRKELHQMVQVLINQLEEHIKTIWHGN